MKIKIEKHDKFTVYSFTAGGHDFQVFQSPVGYWTVYRKPKGLQRNLFGKTFWGAAEMISHYKTARQELTAVVGMV